MPRIALRVAAGILALAACSSNSSSGGGGGGTAGSVAATSEATAVASMTPPEPAPQSTGTSDPSFADLISEGSWSFDLDEDGVADSIDLVDAVLSFTRRSADGGGTPVLDDAGDEIEIPLQSNQWFACNDDGFSITSMDVVGEGYEMRFEYLDMSGDQARWRPEPGFVLIEPPAARERALGCPPA